MSNEQNDFKRILQSASIEQIVSPYAQLKKGGKSLSARCPLPSHDDKSPSFHVYPEDNSFCCFGCGARGDGVDFLQEMLGVEPIEALKMIASIAGVPPPSPLKKSFHSNVKDYALQRLWDSCVDPAPETGNFVSRLEKSGWPARPYRHRALFEASITLGANFQRAADSGMPAFQRSALARPVDMQTYPPLDGGFVVAGRKLGMNDTLQPTGFIVMSVGATGSLQVIRRLESETSTACVIGNAAACSNRIGVEQVFLSDHPVRAMRANRVVPSLFPAAPYWRPQDVRCARSAFPNATLIIDANGFSDKSWNTMARQMGASLGRVRVGASLTDMSSIVPALDFRVMQLVSHWKGLQDNEDVAADSVVLTVAQERAQAFLDALAGAPAMRLVCGQHMAEAGMSVNYEPVVDQYQSTTARAPRALQPIGEKVKQDKVASSFACAPYWLHTLDPILVDLPYVNVDVWAKIQPEKFSDHAGIARAITLFLRDPSIRSLSTERYHSAFWSFASRLSGPDQVPAPLIDFWRRRMVNNNDFWEKTHPAKSVLYNQAVDRVTRSIGYVLADIQKEDALHAARLASVDPEYEEQMRAAALARLGVSTHHAPAQQVADDGMHDSPAECETFAPGSD